MRNRFLMIAAILFLSAGVASAQTPDADTIAAARSLVTTMKLDNQFKALLPIILQGLKPAFVQNRPDVERDFDAIMPKMLEAFAPYYKDMIDGIVTVYANNFTAPELREIDAFYRQPVGQKMLEKTQTIMRQSMQVGQEFGQKAAEDLRERMAEELRKKGHAVPAQ